MRHLDSKLVFAAIVSAMMSACIPYYGPDVSQYSPATRPEGIATARISGRRKPTRWRGGHNRLTLSLHAHPQDQAFLPEQIDALVGDVEVEGLARDAAHV